MRKARGDCGIKGKTVHVQVVFFFFFFFFGGGSFCFGLVFWKGRGVWLLLVFFFFWIFFWGGMFFFLNEGGGEVPVEKFR